MATKFILNGSRRPGEIAKFSVEEFDMATAIGEGQLDTTIHNHKTGRKKAAKLTMSDNDASECRILREVVSKLGSEQPKHIFF